MNLDLQLLERWLSGWSLARGLPLPRHEGGGLVVDVGWPEQLRRHVFVDAGTALRACASGIHAPFIYLKATVDQDTMRRALPACWQMDSQRYLMHRPAAMLTSLLPPPGYVRDMHTEHGANVIRFIDATGQIAASGRVAIHHGSAIFDRIETLEAHRRKGLGSALMCALDAVATQAGASERLLVATEAGRALYQSLGWQVLAPYSTAVLASAEDERSAAKSAFMPLM